MEKLLLKLLDQPKIKCRNNEFVNIEALCVPVICSTLMGQRSFENSKTHTEFRKLYLADFTANIEEKNISIPIGLDYYFLIIKGNVIRSVNDNLVTLKSKLGYKLVVLKTMNVFEYSNLSSRLFCTRT